MICPQCNKKFTKTHHSQKYCSKECSKEIIKKNNREFNKIYRQSDKGKKYNKEFSQSIKGKEAYKNYSKSEKGRNSQKKYKQSSKGKEVNKVYQKKYQQTDKYKQAQKEYQQSDNGKEAYKKSNKKYAQSERGKNTINKNSAKRRKLDPIYNLQKKVRARLHVFLKAAKIKKTNKTFTMVGCTPEFLKKHLEKQFHRHPDTHQPMNWKNHTVHGWHIDHRIPLDKAKTPGDVEELMHYTNLQPLWAEYNIKKGNKY